MSDPLRPEEYAMTTVHHRYASVEGHRLFYREAGPADAPVFVLLHGFPTSSYMFRNLIPILAERYHVIAPDHLGFGLSDAPHPRRVRLHVRGPVGVDDPPARSTRCHTVRPVRPRLRCPDRLAHGRR